LSTTVTTRSRRGSRAVRPDVSLPDDDLGILTQVHPTVVEVRELFSHHEDVRLCVTPAETERWITRELFTELGKEYAVRVKAGMSTIPVEKAMDAAKFYAEALRRVNN